MRKTMFFGTLATAALLALPAMAATDVPLAPFKSVGLQGGGDVVLKHGDVQRVTLLKGSTAFTTFKVQGNSLNIEACNNNCPSHYDLQIEIVSPAVDSVAIEGGGTIKAEGSFPATGELSAAVSGGGDIDVRGISAGRVNAAVNGGGGIRTTATQALNAAVSGGGDITYWGNPEVRQAVSGGGAVEHASR
jgi:hypothetical protein